MKVYDICEFLNSIFAGNTNVSVNFVMDFIEPLLVKIVLKVEAVALDLTSSMSATSLLWKSDLVS